MHIRRAIADAERYHAPSALEAAIASFVQYGNDCRYHEALDNVTPVDLYFGRYTQVRTQRERIKQAMPQQRGSGTCRLYRIQGKKVEVELDSKQTGHLMIVDSFFRFLEFEVGLHWLIRAKTQFGDQT